MIMKKCEIHHNKIRRNTPNDKINRTELVYTLKSKINVKYFGGCAHQNEQSFLTRGPWAPNISLAALKE